MGFKEKLVKSCDEIKAGAARVGNSIKDEYRRNQLKNSLDDMYLSLGKVRYAELSENAENREETEKLAAEIKRLVSEIYEIETEGGKKRVCSVCGKKTDSDAQFCPYCGAKKE